MAGAPSGVWGGAPSNILNTKPHQGLGQSPNRRGSLPPPFWLHHQNLFLVQWVYGILQYPNVLFLGEFGRGGFRNVSISLDMELNILRNVGNNVLDQ